MTLKPFAAFDIDGTLIRWQLYHAMADALARQRIFDADAYDAVRQARLKWKQRTNTNSYSDYEHSLVAAYEKVLSNLAISEFHQAADEVFSEYKDQVYTYTRDLIRNLKSQGYLLFAISGSQTEIVSKIAEYYGFDDFIGTTYVSQNDRFTGEIILAKNTKHEALKAMAKKHGATYTGSIAVGDSESDISMLKSVERPIAFNPTIKLFDHAKEAGWSIVIERKNVIYRLELRDGKYLLA